MHPIQVGPPISHLYSRHVTHQSAAMPGHRSLLAATRTFAPFSLPRARPLFLPLRPLSTTPARLLATPQTGPQRVSPGPIRTPTPDSTSVADSAHPGSRKPGETDPNAAGVAGVAYPDYSKGPSALDKASQLFFFTEIIRGERRTSTEGRRAERDGFDAMQLTWTGGQACGSCWSNSFDHHTPSCIPSKRARSRLGSEVSMR